MKTYAFVIITACLFVLGSFIIYSSQQTPQCKFVNDFIENGHAGITYEEYQKHGSKYKVTVKGFSLLNSNK